MNGDDSSDDGAWHSGDSERELLPGPYEPDRRGFMAKGKNVLSRVVSRLRPPKKIPEEIPAINLLNEYAFFRLAFYSAPEDAVCLSCTCRHARETMPTEQLTPRERQSLILRLEMDFAATHVLCFRCGKLHTLSSLPKCDDEMPNLPKEHCLAQPPFKMPGRDYRVTFLHGRAVMNRYLYGSPAGLPAESLETLVKRASRVWMDGDYIYGEASYGVTTVAADIVEGQLVLRARHVVGNSGKIYHEGKKELARIAGSDRHHICQHHTVRDFLSRTPDEMQRHGSGRPVDQVLVLQRHVAHCDECATDHFVEMTSEGREKGRTEFRLTAESFHLLGSFRYDDFRTPCTSQNPGSIREAWYSHKHLERVGRLRWTPSRAAEEEKLLLMGEEGLTSEEEPMREEGEAWY